MKQQVTHAILKAIIASSYPALAFLNFERLAERGTPSTYLKPQWDLERNTFSAQVEDRMVGVRLPNFMVQMKPYEAYYVYSVSTDCMYYNHNDESNEYQRRILGELSYTLRTFVDFGELKRLCIEKRLFTEKRLENERLKIMVSA